MVVLVWHGEPWMLEKLLCTWALSWFPLEDGEHKVSKHIGFLLLEPILLHQQSLQREVAKLVDVLKDELACSLITLVELVEEGSAYRIILRHWPKELNHLRQVIVSLAIVLTLAWVEKEITSD